MGSIALFTKYLNQVDFLYSETSKSAILDGNNAIVSMSKGCNEMKFPKITVDGLSDYSRTTGYEAGDVSVEFESKKPNYDRGIKFNIDVMDDEETDGIMFGNTLGLLEKDKVAPEIDAFRFATYASAIGISTVAPADLTTGEAVLNALVTATAQMDNDSVEMNDRVLFITPTLLLAAENVDTTKSKSILSRFSSIVQVPQSRFYTAIDLKSKSADSATGYEKASGAKNINFMIISKSAVIQFTKHVFNKPLSPDNNPDGDSWVIRYRKYGIAEVYDNKKKGIYLHKATT